MSTNKARAAGWAIVGLGLAGAGAIGGSLILDPQAKMPTEVAIAGGALGLGLASVMYAVDEADLGREEDQDNG